MSAVAVETLDPASPDVGVPAHYGDPIREQRALLTGVGVVDRSHRGVIALTGAERLRWLHDLTTQHLAALTAGEGTETLVLSPHGHLEHHALVTEDGTTTWLDTEPGAAGPLTEFLLRMRFLTQVEPSEVTAGRAVLTLVGPEVERALAALGAILPAPPDLLPVPPAKFRAGTVPPRPTARYAVTALPPDGLVRRGRLGVDLLLPAARVPEVLATLGAAGVPRCGLWAYEAVRVAARIPRVGIDTDARTLPAEAGLIGPAVHLEKGCYRGQETVAKVHHLGRPPRRLALLHLDGMTTDQLPPPGTEVRAADRRVGVLGTAVHHAELGPVALALVRHQLPADAVLSVGESTAAVDPG